MIYTMIFMTAEDKENFVVSSKHNRRFSVVNELDRRTINIRFRKGTNAKRIFNLCDIWNADIYGLTTPWK